MKFRKGPSSVAVGCTQASVSANNKPLPEVIDTPTMVSESEEAIVGSIIDRADDALFTAVAAIGDAGVTKADTPLIIDIMAKHKNVVRRSIIR